MIRRLLSCLVLLISALPCAAIPITPFVDVPTFIERSRDIVIARCVRPDVGEGTYIDNLHPAEVEVLTVLKGDRPPGKMRIATVYNLAADKTYFLANSGGFAYETHFLTVANRTVVPLPASFRLDDLKGRKLTEQVQAVFSAAGLPEKEDRLPQLPGEVLMLPEAGVPLLEFLVSEDRERLVRAVRKLQESRTRKEMQVALRVVEEATTALKATLANPGAPKTPSVPRKP
jgi:hypothetical protein